MNLRQLEVFHAIMRTASITGAARALNVSQPAVSIMLRHMESQLGMKLFQRIRGRLHPTPEAHRIFPDIDSIFARVDTVQRVLQDLKDARSGTVTVAASPTLVAALVPPAVAELRRERPQVRAVVQSLPTEQVVARVARREVDMGIVYDVARNSETEFETIGAAHVACVMRPDHPLAARRAVDAQHLADEALITYGPTTPLGSKIAETFQAHGNTLNVGVQVTHSLTACLLAREGAGIALIDPLIPLSDLFPGLAVRPLRPRISVDIVLLFARDRPRSRIVAEFARILRAPWQESRAKSA